MPMTYNMETDSEIFRGILAYDYRDTQVIPNPDYNPNSRGYSPKEIREEIGPVLTREFTIGPYATVKPIKTYITSKRNRYGYKNLRIVRVERVAKWEEVEL